MTDEKDEKMDEVKIEHTPEGYVGSVGKKQTGPLPSIHRVLQELDEPEPNKRPKIPFGLMFYAAGVAGLLVFTGILLVTKYVAGSATAAVFAALVVLVLSAAYNSSD